MGSGVSQEVGGNAPYCDLAGEWLATRKEEWKNRNWGTPHKKRAAMSKTKMIYDNVGNGKGWVGELYVKVKTTKLATGQYSAIASVPLIFWKAGDGNLTILKNGILEVRYASNGIVEYWRRKDPGKQLLQRALSHSDSFEPPLSSHQPVAHAVVQVQPTQAQFASLPVAAAVVPRPLILLFRKFKLSTWHWALGVGDLNNNPSIYEIGGLDNAIIGPKGRVCGIPLPSKSTKYGTKMNQYDGYILLKNRSTNISNKEIEIFSKAWQQRHPVWIPLGPNCQTFSEDLHIYLTGLNLEFDKVGDLKQGPEISSNAIWF